MQRLLRSQSRRKSETENVESTAFGPEWLILYYQEQKDHLVLCRRISYIR